MPGDPVLDQARALVAAGKLAEARALLLANGFEAAERPAPTGHAGKPFVNAPEMANTHNGKAFVDAEPEPSLGQQLSGGYAALGKYIAGDEQTAARALTREHGASDVLAAIKNAPANPVRDAIVRAVPVLAGPLAMRALRETPSYARAKQDIDAAEESAGGAGHVAAATGAGLGLAAAGEGALGLARDVMSPVTGKVAGGRISRLARRGVEGVRKLAFPAEKSLATPMESLASQGRAPFTPIRRAPLIEGAEPDMGLQTPIESLADQGRVSHPIQRAHLAEPYEPGVDVQSPMETATAQDRAPFRPIQRAHLAETHTPRMELQSPMETVADLARARPSAAADVASVKTPAAGDAAPGAPPKKAPRQSSRTQAQFKHFAERMGAEPEPPAPSPVPPDATAGPEPDLEAIYQQSLANVKIARALGLNPLRPIP